MVNTRGAPTCWRLLSSNRPVPFPIDRHLPYAVYFHLFNSTSSPSSCYSPPPTSIDIHSHIQRIPLISLHSTSVSPHILWPTRTVTRASTATPLRKCAPSRPPPRRRRPRHLLPRRGLRHPRLSQTLHSRPQHILRRTPHFIPRLIPKSTHHHPSPRRTHFRSSHQLL